MLCLHVFQEGVKKCVQPDINYFEEQNIFIKMLSVVPVCKTEHAGPVG
jgi:hypothetical protein